MESHGKVMEFHFQISVGTLLYYTGTISCLIGLSVSERGGTSGSSNMIASRVPTPHLMGFDHLKISFQKIFWKQLNIGLPLVINGCNCQGDDGIILISWAEGVKMGLTHSRHQRNVSQDLRLLLLPLKIDHPGLGPVPAHARAIGSKMFQCWANGLDSG